MKVKELKAVLNHDDQHDDDELVVTLDKPSVGSVAYDKVKNIGFGFDWEHGKVLIWTESSIVKKSPNEDAYDMCRDLLMYLATKPLKKKTYEVELAQNILKRVGCTDEDFEKYRKLFHRDM